MQSERILVIDDDPASLLLLIKVLQLAGVSAIGRTSAPAAAEVARLGISAVVFDLHLGATGGDQVARQYHAVRELRDVPFILISADPEGLERATQRTPWLHCVVKGPSLEPVVEKVRALLERRRASSPLTTSGLLALEDATREGLPRDTLVDPPERLSRDTHVEGSRSMSRDERLTRREERRAGQASPHATNSAPRAHGDVVSMGSHPYEPPRAESQRMSRDTRPELDPPAWARQQDSSLHQRPASSARDQARRDFVGRARGAAYSLRGFLVGNLLGPRAHAEVSTRLLSLRDDCAALPSRELTLLEALDLCVKLSDEARQSARAMQALTATVAWLGTLDERVPFPQRIEDVAPLRGAHELVD